MSCTIRYFLFAVVLLMGCKKTEVHIDQPQACISMYSKHDFFPLKIVLKDTLVEFNSCSQGHDSYRWDFGDGSTSTDSMPAHYFRKTGKYNVTLIAGKRNAAFDTAHTTVNVILGPVALPLVYPNQDGEITGLVEMPDSGFMLLVPKKFYEEYALVALNNDLAIIKNTSINTSYMLEDMQLTHDGNLLLIGSNINSTNFGVIIKMNTAGETLWTKQLPASTRAIHAARLADNGWIVTAKDMKNNADTYTQTPRTTLYRIDQNGNILWSAYAPKMGYTLNCEVLPDGFVVAGGYLDYNNRIQLVIAKFSTTGGLLWRQEISAGEGSPETIMKAKTLRLPDNNLGVALRGISRSLYMFSPTGQFLDKRYIGEATSTSADFCTTAGGQLAFAQVMPTSGVFITRTDPQGYVLGTTKYQVPYAIIDGAHYPGFSPRRIFPLRKGGTLSFYRRRLWELPSDLLLFKVDDQGMPL